MLPASGTDGSAETEPWPTYRGGVNDVDLAAVGRLLGEPSRAAMLDALMTGRALAAGELAQVAGIGRPAASEHLARLVEAGLVEVVAQGRHRYHRLAGPRVASALEALSHIAPPKQVRSLRQSAHARSLAFARTCYDHLAGSCGVALHDAVLDRGWLVPERDTYHLTAPGAVAFAELGLDVTGLRAGRRPLARACLDWTERRSHLAGSLAAAFTELALDRGWLVRRSRDSRGLRLTDSGSRALRELGCRLG
jgi:DNA-binding transcriptional ArsR family regulator